MIAWAVLVHLDNDFLYGRNGSKKSIDKLQRLSDNVGVV
jgi:hypothetical protein